MDLVFYETLMLNTCVYMTVPFKISFMSFRHLFPSADPTSAAWGQASYLGFALARASRA